MRPNTLHLILTSRIGCGRNRGTNLAAERNQRQRRNWAVRIERARMSGGPAMADRKSPSLGAGSAKSDFPVPSRALATPRAPKDHLVNVGRSGLGPPRKDAATTRASKASFRYVRIYVAAIQVRGITPAPSRASYLAPRRAELGWSEGPARERRCRSMCRAARLFG